MLKNIFKSFCQKSAFINPPELVCFTKIQIFITSDTDQCRVVMVRFSDLFCLCFHNVEGDKGMKLRYIRL